MKHGNIITTSKNDVTKVYKNGLNFVIAQCKRIELICTESCLISMENHEEVSRRDIKSSRELEKCTKAANEKLRQNLRGYSVAEMIVEIRKMNLSDRSLTFLCEGIALEHEDYEICIAVEKIKKEQSVAS